MTEINTESKCKNCIHFVQYSDYKMKCNFYASFPRNKKGDELCDIDNNGILGFEAKQDETVFTK